MFDDFIHTGTRIAKTSVAISIAASRCLAPNAVGTVGRMSPVRIAMSPNRSAFPSLDGSNQHSVALEDGAYRNRFAVGHPRSGAPFERDAVLAQEFTHPSRGQAYSAVRVSVVEVHGKGSLREHLGHREEFGIAVVPAARRDSVRANLVLAHVVRTRRTRVPPAPARSRGTIPTQRETSISRTRRPGSRRSGRRTPRSPRKRRRPSPAGPRRPSLSRTRPAGRAGSSAFRQRRSPCAGFLGRFVKPARCYPAASINAR